MGTLIIDKVIMNETPQHGTWLFCFSVTHGEDEYTFNIPDKEFEGDGITIEMNLEVFDVERGDEVTFFMGLDNDQSDVCSNNPSEKCDGKIRASSSGSKRFNPRDDWSFILYFHMQ
ncbi:hypothetical protein [Peribacillus butanolivorans]|uniref:hypothetical protein n=1 Tax=Peribacillus butanolivorans TaxID=421767 RepID=UPI0036DF70B1